MDREDSLECGKLGIVLLSVFILLLVSADGHHGGVHDSIEQDTICDSNHVYSLLSEV